MPIKETLIHVLNVLGLSVFEPVVRLVAGEDPRQQLKSIFQLLVVPVLAFALFLGVWAVVSQKIVTNYGTLPTPRDVWTAAGNLVDDYRTSRADEAAFYRERDAQAAEYEAIEGELQAALASASAAQRTPIEEKIAQVQKRSAELRDKRFSRGPTYIDQIATSLRTVFAGFLIASLIAIPIGILCGLSRVFQAAIAPLIQIFKPVSPLAWLPLVMIVVGAVYTTDPREAWFEKSFISSAFTVALCSLWPTLTNTALGVASIDKDHINVAKVLNLDLWTRIRKIVIPSSLPLIFAGLRISLGVGWMVLIAAEMLSQNPGLGKFVWNMFQNGSSQTLAQIMVAVFTIGIIGFALDRTMVVLQRTVSYDAKVAT
jgi:nitrate/nitrite transport system permease protein